MKKAIYLNIIGLLITVSIKSQQPNVLVITADDMNWNTVASFQGQQQGINVTPHIDDLAKQGNIFTNAHVASTACMPSRNAINTGRLPHRSGGEGFHDLRIKNIPTIPNTFDANGYFVGIIGKVVHSTPYEDITPWHIAEEMDRNTDKFYGRVNTVIDSALNTVGKPFYLIVNSHDPHRPYYNLNSVGTKLNESLSHPSKVYYPEDVSLPSWLPDHPDVRSEMAEYLSSCRRFDDVLGKVLQVLEEQNIVENTIVIFLSDHGMAAPSIKSNLYHHSTKTPLIMRWPANHKLIPDTQIAEMTSTLDIFPTLLEACNISTPDGLDGKSLWPLIRGEQQQGRELLFSTYNTTIGKNIYAFRKIHSSKYAFIFNPWTDGRATYNSSSLGASFFETMLNEGQVDDYWKNRCNFILSRTPEEFYDIENDPDCLNNLIYDASYETMINEYRAKLKEQMELTIDPMLSVFNTYLYSNDQQLSYLEFISAIEEANWIGHAPKLVIIEDKWTIYPPEGTLYNENFENSPYKYSNLGGAVVSITDNPLKEGINTSNRVLKVKRESNNAKSYVGASVIVSKFDAPRYMHMKVLKSKPSVTRFQLSAKDNSNKIIKESTQVYNSDNLNKWQDLVFDMGENYMDCEKLWFQVDYTSELGPHEIYIDDIIFNNNPNSREILTSNNNILFDNILLFPNPANGKLNLSCNGNCSAEIMDLNGNIIGVFNTQQIQNGMDISNLKRGLYIIRIHLLETTLAKSFVKR